MTERANRLLIWANGIRPMKVIVVVESVWMLTYGLSFLIADPEFVRRTYLYEGLQSLGGTRMWSVLLMVAAVYLMSGVVFKNLRALFFGATLGLLQMIFAISIYVTELPDSWTSLANAALPLTAFLAFTTFKVTVMLGRGTVFSDAA